MAKTEKSTDESQSMNKAYEVYENNIAPLEEPAAQQKYSVRDRFGGTTYMTYEQVVNALNKGTLAPAFAQFFKTKFKL